MDDLISRQAVQTELKNCEVVDMYDENDNFVGYYNADTVDSIVRNLPSVKPQTGYWILKIEDWCKWTCSKCGHTERTDIHVSLGYDFCPKCGAKMLEEPTGSESEG